MFSSVYQGGPVLEVLAAADKSPSWSVNKLKWKIFDKSAKGYIISLDSHTSKLLFPKTEKQALGLIQPYIVFQIYLQPTQSFSLEIGVSDISNTKRRLLFTNSAKEIISTPLHARIPNLCFKRGTWMNLSIDIASFLSSCFAGSTFKSVDSFSVHSFCRVRRVFTMRSPLPDDSVFLEHAESIPRNFAFPPGVSSLNQLIDTETVGMESPVAGAKPIERPRIQTQLAFGSRVPLIPKTPQEKGNVATDLRTTTSIAKVFGTSPYRVGTASSIRYHMNEGCESSFVEETKKSIEDWPEDGVKGVYCPHEYEFDDLVNIEGSQSGTEEAEFAGDEQVELVYDPVLNCYYDPNTHEYYEVED